MNKPFVLALIGGIAAASVQRLTPTGWWLNSGQGVAIASAALALLAIIVGVTEGRPLSSGGVLRPIYLWAGANIGLAIYLFAVGPGNLFPIALMFGAGISALAVAAGSLIGQLTRAVWARVGSQRD
jgi:hypothetical protein